MNALLQQFIQESREALEGIGHSLLAMERNPDDAGKLDELFRLVHTLKGNSGLFDYPALTQVLHAAEDVMDAVRQNLLVFSQALADQLLDAADYVALFLDEVEVNEQPGDAFQLAPRVLVDGLRGLLAGNASDEAPQECAEQSETAPALELPDDAQVALQQAQAAGHSVFYVDYRPNEQCFFHGTDPLHQVRQLPQVLWRRIGARQPWAPLESLDAYQCNLRIELLLISTHAQLAEHFRYMADDVTWQLLTPTQTFVPFTTLACDVLRTQLQVLQRYVAAQWPHGAQLAVLRTLENVLRCERPGLLPELRGVVKELEAGAGAELLLMWINDLLANEPAPELAANEQHIDHWLSDLLETPDSAALTPAAVAARAPTAEVASVRRQDDSASASAKVLKVEQEKIDRLMNYIGEIVVAKNGLPYLAERAENHYGQRELAREIKAQYAVINRIAEDLQDSIMQVRLMPVSFVLQRFPRLVRDIARKLGKQVNLIVEGEDTEADKAMIEALADPLVHVVRNALDHGLETVAEREAAGKAATGTLRIRASQNGDHVLLDIEDDGRGIDPQKIKAKVAEKGLLEPEKLAAMSEQELINLVFLPGFSTAAQISDLSGRGVGMDVVRSAIERVGGHLRLSSQLGAGTKLSLSLPLSMAVTQVMVIESAGQRFGVPMEQVVETVRLPRQAIHHIKQQPLAQLRGRTIPLSGLNELLVLNEPQQVNDDDEHALMVLRSHGELLGLIIDDFHGSLDIILKPMVGILGDMPGYCGTAVMGDGSILMVLNPAEMFV